jgi:hypothetical protein
MNLIRVGAERADFAIGGGGLSTVYATPRLRVTRGIAVFRAGPRDHTTATLTLWIGGSESNRQSHFSPPSLPIQS